MRITIFSQRSAYILGHLGDLRVRNPLFELLHDKNLRVRIKAIEAFGNLRDSASIPSLSQVLQDSENSHARVKAAEALGKIADRDSINDLMHALSDKEYAVRREAVLALVKIGDVKAVAPIVNLLFKKNIPFDVLRPINKLLKLNQPFVNAFPHLLCQECFLRSERNNVKMGVFAKRGIVQCRGCASSLTLTSGVKEVIGLIGGVIEDHEQIGDKFYVNLWSEQEKQSRNADIDVLQIRTTTKHKQRKKADIILSYEYAINAVCNTFKNDMARLKRLKEIPVLLLADQQVSDGSKRLLENEFGSVKIVNGFK